MLKRKTTKRVIEAGMIGSMVGMVGTGIVGSKKPHIVTSAAFMAFTLCHYAYYRPFFKKKRKASRLRAKAA